MSQSKAKTDQTPKPSYTEVVGDTMSRTMRWQLTLGNLTMGSSSPIPHPHHQPIGGSAWRGPVPSGSPFMGDYQPTAFERDLLKAVVEDMKTAVVKIERLLAESTVNAT